MSLEWSTHKFERDGVKLVYHQKGAGEPMLLLHGITDNGKGWGRVADALAREYTVYALDQRAHGESDAPPSGYAYADYAADAVELLRVKGHANAVLMGHSFGGMVGYTMAANFPSYVAKLILVDPPLLDVPHDAPAEIIDRERYAWFEWLRALKPLSRAELIARCHRDSPRWSDDECETWADSKLQVRSRLWKKDGVQIADDWRAALQKIVCPTLLVYGERERAGLVDAAKANQVVALLKQGEAAFIPNAGHCIHRDEYEAFMAEVNAFLQVTG